MKYFIFLVILLLETASLYLFFILTKGSYGWQLAALLILVSLLFSAALFYLLVFIMRRYTGWMRVNIKRAISSIQDPHQKRIEEKISSDIFSNIVEIVRESHENTRRDIAKRDEFIKWLTGEVNRCSFELNRRNKEMIEKEKVMALSHLVATLAHKMGTPLNSISGHLQLILAGNNIDYDTRNRLEIVKNELYRIEKIIRQAMDVLILNRQKVEPVNLKYLLSETIDFLLPSLHQDVESIEMSIESDTPLVYTDPDMLREVVMNLISNAGEAICGKGFIKVSGGRRRDGLWFVSVQDNGIGISSELKDKIFEPFFTTKHKGSASGLGLAICKEIARAMGGDIEVESIIGKGSIFTFTFTDQREGNCNEEAINSDRR